MCKWLVHTKVEGDCLVWTKCINTDGYARAGPNIKVHREVFNDTNGYYPEVVRHSCDNRRCINPEHLLGGNHYDNMRDRKDRGRVPHQVFQEEKDNVLSLRAQKATIRTIAETLSIKQKRVEYILNLLRKES